MHLGGLSLFSLKRPSTQCACAHTCVCKCVFVILILIVSLSMKAEIEVESVKKKNQWFKSADNVYIKKCNLALVEL